MNTNKRNGNRWTVNELLSLQREYELLEWNIQQIAEKHQRTERAIIYRLESEGIITSWNAARGFMESYKASFEEDVVTEDCVCNEETYVDDDDDDVQEEQECCENDSEYDGDEEEDDEGYEQEDELGDEQEDDDGDEEDASEVEKLSERVWSLETSIKDMVQHLFNNLVSSNKKKRKPLRKPLRKPISEKH